MAKPDSKKRNDLTRRRACPLVTPTDNATIGRHNAAQRVDAMNDTSAAVSKVVADRHRSMTAAERWLAVSSLFETARAIVESSLPSSLTLEQRRLAVVRPPVQERVTRGGLNRARQIRSYSNPRLTRDRAEHRHAHRRAPIQPLQVSALPYAQRSLFDLGNASLGGVLLKL